MRLSKVLFPAAFALLLSTIFWLAGRAHDTLAIDVGAESDLAFLVDFREPETAPPELGGASFQWSRPVSRIVIPPASAADRWLVDLRVLHRAEQGPSAARLRLGDRSVDLRLQPGWRAYHIFAPTSSGLVLESDTGAISDPELRSLGVAVDLVAAQRVGQGWLPAWPYLLAVAAMTLFWGVVIRLLGLARRDEALVWGGALGLAALALGLQFAHALAAVATLNILLLALSGVGLALSALLRKPLGDLRGVVAGAMVASLFFKGVGILYPGFLPTDTLFHVNRFQFVLDGNFYFMSSGQGQEFPYPVGAYAILTPFLLLLPNLRWLSQGMALVLDTTTIIIIALLMKQAGLPRRAIRWACVLYALMPAGFLLYNQNPMAQNIGQWLGFCYLGLLIWMINRPPDPAGEAPQSVRMARRVPAAWWPLVTLGFLATQGHFGVFLSYLLFGALLLAFNWRFCLEQRRWLVSAVIAAGLAIAVYYLDFARLFTEQVEHLTTQPADPLGVRWFLFRRFTIELGLYGHYGLGYVLAALAGLLWLRRSPRPQEQVLGRFMLGMMATMFVVLVAVLAVLFNAPRYIIFVYPAVAVGAAVAMDRLDAYPLGWLATRAALGVSLLVALMQWAGDFALHDRTGFLL